MATVSVVSFKPSSSLVASTSSSSTGAGFSTLVGGTPGLAAYNTDLAAMSEENRRLMRQQLQVQQGGAGFGAYSSELAQMSAQNSQMIQLQIAMQRENLLFTSISNILKTKHDTLKNTISNIR